MSKVTLNMLRNIRKGQETSFYLNSNKECLSARAMAYFLKKTEEFDCSTKIDYNQSKFTITVH